MNLRFLHTAFYSTRFTVRPPGIVDHSSARRRYPSIPSRVSASRTSNGGKSGCGSGGGRGNGGRGGGRGRGDQHNGDEWHHGISLMVATFAAHALLRVPFGIAAEKNAVEGTDDTWDWLSPMLTSLGFSGLLGFASGAAFKLVGRMAAIGIGLFLVFLQGLVYIGAVDIRWDVIEKRLDLTGDDKFDEEDIKFLYRNIMRVLVQGVPSAGGFAAGFVLGLRMG